MAKIAQMLPNCISVHLTLNGRLILIVRLSSLFLSSVPAEAFLKIKLLIVESIRPLG